MRRSLQAGQTCVLHAIAGLRSRLDERLAAGARAPAWPSAGQLRGWIEVLDNEERKVREMLVVVAVVGTLKAGKSTTINALVGRELLPSRNQPMTSLPTLIRHVPSMREPLLRLGNLLP